jgi:Flp pilus assembly pilin Flp
MLKILKRLLVEQDGQDLIEYALLTAALGFAGAAAFTLLGVSINTAYGAWEDGTNNLWEVPDPVE